MLTAEEARAELKKDMIDRLPENKRGEIKFLLDYFAQDLEDNIAWKIREAVISGKENLEYKVSHGKEYYYDSLGSEYEYLGSMIYPPSDYCILETPDFHNHFMTWNHDYYPKVEFEGVVFKQVDELRSLGYCVEVTVEDGRQHRKIIERNRISLLISWEEVAQQGEVKNKPTPYTPAPEELVEEKEQSELELPKEKKSWWQI